MKFSMKESNIHSMLSWLNNPNNLIIFGGNIGWVHDYCRVCGERDYNNANKRSGKVRVSYICEECLNNEVGKKK